MKSKKIFSILVSLSIIGSFSIGVHAETSDTENKNVQVISEQNLISQEKVYIDGAEVDVKKYNDNGKILNSYNGDVSSDIIQKYLSQEDENHNKTGLEKAASQNTRTDVFTFSGSSSQNSKAICSNSIEYIAKDHDRYVTLNAGGGTNTGIWNGNSCDGIVLHQTFDVSNLGFSISWPAGLSAGQSGSTRTWSSQRVMGNYLNTAHETVSADCMNQNWLKISVTDQADVYLGSSIYKANAAITKGYNDIVR